MATKHKPETTERDMSTWMSVDTPDHKFTIQYDEGRLKVFCNTSDERVELIDQYGFHFHG